MSEINIAIRLASHFPTLKTDLRIAHIRYSPVKFVEKSIKVSLMYATLFSVLFFFVLDKAGLPIVLLLPAWIVFSVLIFQYMMITLKAKIKKRERDINKEVLFVGRYLLVKIYSGRPLLNALIETSSSRGVGAKYIREIVDDIETGNTIEQALTNAIAFSPSEKLRKILFHLNNALQLGIDVTKPLESVLKELTTEEEIEIKRYGKKLNTMVIFYMLAAVILPSLGVAMFIVISSFINLPISLTGLLVFIFFLIVLQFIFITLFRSIRPQVNL
ncbi:MAG TPA: type II secretion system F family protein [Candidatus Nanoarchaeia archaeon]|nr:type II secretion system F family protein [Candidatus Nanoarchaeia archaeon]